MGVTESRERARGTKLGARGFILAREVARWGARVGSGCRRSVWRDEDVQVQNKAIGGHGH